RGPNIWAYRPVLEVWLDIGDLEDSPSNTIPGFYERLTALLPTLVEHRCGIGERGGFLQRLKEGTWPGHILEHVTIELQNLAGMQSGFGKARSTSKRGVYKVVVRSRNEQVSRAALHDARELVLAAMRNHHYDVAATVVKLRDMVDALCLGPSTACIVDAATERGIPSIRLNEGNLVQLGYGARQHRIWTAETDQTSAIAETISRDKDLTKSLLKACGVPVPEGRVANSPEDAWDAAQDIVVPVVVKPSDGNHGRGVSTELMTRAEVERAYHLADAEGSEVIVERYVRGNEHRLLVIGGKLAAAAKGEQAWITGDGRATINQLIDAQLNIDPRRGEAEEFPLDVVNLANNAVPRMEVERQGYTPDSVVVAGKKVLIVRNGNVAIDVTDEVHPEIADMVSLAARIIGLDIAGVDMVAEDISKPLSEQDAAIVEINAGPGLLMHLKPAQGKPRPVGKAIVDSLFNAQDNGRVPIVGICGTTGKSEVAQLVAKLLELSGKHIGLACSAGLSFAGRVQDTRDCANWASAQKVLLNRNVDAAVIENSIATILNEGLGYDRCQVGVITNLDVAQHFGECYIDDPEQVCNVLRTQVDVVLDYGVAVLNAADDLVAGMAKYCDGEVLFFARDIELLSAHRQQGGRGVSLRDGKLLLCTGSEEQALVGLNRIPALNKAQDPHQLDNILAAIGAAWALQVTPEVMRAGLETYANL
ncbi:MAG: cyanophycin synthetase, partial [Gallionella sp.]